MSHKIYTQFCCAILCCGFIISSLWCHMIYLPIFFRVTSLALGQSWDCPSASEVTLKDMGKINLYLTTREHKKLQTLYIIPGIYNVSDTSQTSQAVCFISCFIASHFPCAYMILEYDIYLPFDNCIWYLFVSFFFLTRMLVKLWSANFFFQKCFPESKLPHSTKCPSSIII